MFNGKSFLIVPVLLGAVLLIYGLAFLSVKVVPQADISGGQLMIAITEMIAVIGVCVVAFFGGMYYFAKKQYGHRSHKS